MTGGDQGDDVARLRWLLDSIVEHVPAMIFVKDAAELRFRVFNRAGEALLGLSRDQMLGRDDFDFFPAEQAAFFQQRDRETLRSGKLLDIPEEPIDTRTGRRWLHTRKVPILDAQGRPVYLLGISLDITERREAELELQRSHHELERRVEQRTQELRTAQEQLLHAAKLEAVGRLAGGIAHDFNNMLAVILGQVGLLSRHEAVDDRLREGLLEVRGAAERAVTLTRQLLAFSRRQIMQPRRVDLNETVERARGMLERLIGEHIRLETTLAPDLVDVEADPAVIEQIVVNLAVNARDAMLDGGTLTIRTEHDADGAALIVEDTGIGMDEATQARIFDPFFTTKPAGEGTGLGLSTVYGAVTQSNGRITVRTSPGCGTAFRIVLPCADADTFSTRPPGPESDFPPGIERILLVEDEPRLRTVARAILEQAGYEVVEAASGAEALTIAEASREAIDLLLTDVVMPDLSGPKLAQQLRALSPGAAVLYMSGYLGDETSRGALDPPGTLLSKPFTALALARAVRRALDGRIDVARRSSA